MHPNHIHDIIIINIINNFNLITAAILKRITKTRYLYQR